MHQLFCKIHWLRAFHQRKISGFFFFLSRCQVSFLTSLLSNPSKTSSPFSPVVDNNTEVCRIKFPSNRIILKVLFKFLLVVRNYFFRCWKIWQRIVFCLWRAILIFFSIIDEKIEKNFQRIILFTVGLFYVYWIFLFFIFFFFFFL